MDDIYGSYMALLPRLVQAQRWEKKIKGCVCLMMMIQQTRRDTNCLSCVFVMVCVDSQSLRCVYSRFIIIISPHHQIKSNRPIGQSWKEDDNDDTSQGHGASILSVIIVHRAQRDSWHHKICLGVSRMGTYKTRHYQQDGCSRPSGGKSSLFPMM